MEPQGPARPYGKDVSGMLICCDKVALLGENESNHPRSMPETQGKYALWKWKNPLQDELSQVENVDGDEISTCSHMFLYSHMMNMDR